MLARKRVRTAWNGSGLYSGRAGPDLAIPLALLLPWATSSVFNVANALYLANPKT
jgi:hypothetical protein